MARNSWMTVVRALICENHMMNLILYLPLISGTLKGEKWRHIVSPKSFAIHVVCSFVMLFISFWFFLNSTNSQILASFCLLNSLALAMRSVMLQGRLIRLSISQPQGACDLILFYNPDPPLSVPFR